MNRKTYNTIHFKFTFTELKQKIFASSKHFQEIPGAGNRFRLLHHRTQTVIREFLQRNLKKSQTM